MGFRVEFVDAVPPQIKSDFVKATEEHETTVHGKKVRVKYIPITRLSDESKKLISEHLSSFPHLYLCTLRNQEKLYNDFAGNFRRMLEESCRLFDR